MPLAIYDGRCGFCRRWVARWRARTGRRVIYLPLQAPIPLWSFGVSRRAARESFQLVERGRVSSGADAVFRLLRYAPGVRWIGWLGRLPVMRTVARWTYRWIARHRPIAGRIDRWLFGRSTEPPTSRLVSSVSLRGLGLIYLAAFTSLRRQVLGLYGRRGILPIGEFLATRRAAVARPIEAYRRWPTVFWLSASDAALVRACRAGELLGLAVVLGVAPLPALASLWILYTSFVSVGRDFLRFQWDALLLEAGALALLVAPARLRPRFAADEPAWPAVLLWRWLAFRLHYESGLAKLQSGDPTWRERTACCYHFETQPLPTPVGWYLHHAPRWVQRAQTHAVLALELVVPFLAFGPRRVRRAGFWLLSGLQGAIAVTGNYGFFNALSTTTLLWLLDDEGMPRPLRSWRRRRESVKRPEGLQRFVIAVCAGALGVISLAGHRLAYGKRPPPAFLMRAFAAAQRWRLVNTYGLFAVMTVSRPEIVIEGSDDGRHWLEYELRYKPSDPRRGPRWVAPHQPRLDWQLWFAAMDLTPEWFARLVVRLLEASPEVLALFASSPFGARAPRYVRAVLYDYRMTDLATRRATGAWWRRERIGLYFPPVSLSRQSLEEREARSTRPPADARSPSQDQHR